MSEEQCPGISLCNFLQWAGTAGVGVTLAPLINKVSAAHAAETTIFIPEGAQTIEGLVKSSKTGGSFESITSRPV